MIHKMKLKELSIVPVKIQKCVRSSLVRQWAKTKSSKKNFQMSAQLHQTCVKFQIKRIKLILIRTFLLYLRKVPQTGYSTVLRTHHFDINSFRSLNSIRNTQIKRVALNRMRVIMNQVMLSHQSLKRTKNCLQIKMFHQSLSIKISTQSLNWISNLQFPMTAVKISIYLRK